MKHVGAYTEFVLLKRPVATLTPLQSQKWASLGTQGLTRELMLLNEAKHSAFNEARN